MQQIENQYVDNYESGKSVETAKLGETSESGQTGKYANVQYILVCQCMYVKINLLLHCWKSPVLHLIFVKFSCWCQKILK